MMIDDARRGCARRMATDGECIRMYFASSNARAMGVPIASRARRTAPLFAHRLINSSRHPRGAGWIFSREWEREGEREGREDVRS